MYFIPVHTQIRNPGIGQDNNGHQIDQLVESGKGKVAGKGRIPIFIHRLNDGAELYLNSKEATQIKLFQLNQIMHGFLRMN